MAGDDRRALDHFDIIRSQWSPTRLTLDGVHLHITGQIHIHRDILRSSGGFGTKASANNDKNKSDGEPANSNPKPGKASRFI